MPSPWNLAIVLSAALPTADEGMPTLHGDEVSPASLDGRVAPGVRAGTRGCGGGGGAPPRGVRGGRARTRRRRRNGRRAAPHHQAADGRRGGARGGRDRGRRLRRRRAAARRARTSSRCPRSPASRSRPTRASRVAGKIYDQASPAVVSIRTDSGSGTGFLIDRKGTLVTNAHVVGSADRVVVKFGTDGRSIDGQVKGADASSDLAVVTIDPGSAPGQRQAAAVRRLAPGPRGRHRHRDRQPLRPGPHGDRGHRLGHRALDHRAQRLLDRRGHPDRRADQPRQLRRPAARRDRAASWASTPRSPPRAAPRRATSASASPCPRTPCARSSRAWRRATASRARTSASRPAIRPTPTRPPGAEVTSVVPGGPADGAGLNPGDVITELDGQTVKGPSDVSRIVAAKKPGDHLDLRVDRSGQDVTLDATLQNRPAHTP